MSRREEDDDDIRYEGQNAVRQRCYVCPGPTTGLPRQQCDCGRRVESRVRDGVCRSAILYGADCDTQVS
jgi:hypothetical protein